MPVRILPMTSSVNLMVEFDSNMFQIYKTKSGLLQCNVDLSYPRPSDADSVTSVVVKKERGMHAGLPNCGRTETSIQFFNICAWVGTGTTTLMTKRSSEIIWKKLL